MFLFIDFKEERMAAAYKRKQVRVIMLVNVKTESLSGGYLLKRPYFLVLDGLQAWSD